ncbi:MAG: NADH-quinone oxidoreductase subunit NuoF [Candidatus Hydrogenedentes bacterium]|nr:NADH-quinone oxidoreductase subunit NuoF [Candidatus Hydrogenedentota bacterium]
MNAIRRYLAQERLHADIVEVGCLGLCSQEPLVDVQLPGRARIAFQKVTEDRVPELLGAILEGKVPWEQVLGQWLMPGHRPWDGVQYLSQHPFFELQRRCVLKNCGVIDPSRIDEYIARGGYGALAQTLNQHTPEQVCGIVESSGLRGRGGGGFPTGKKWRIALEQPSAQRYLICNADEGDPGAFMDRAVIEGDPHRLLEGMALAAYAIGATRAYVYIRAEYPLAIERLEGAIAQARECGLVGANVLDSGFSLDIVIKQGAGAFVCGEETALIHSIEGKRGMPRPRPPFPAVEGLFGHPTVINNVETLANVPAILARGAAWFAGMGTETSKGTKVFAVSGKVVRTGLVEVEMGTTLRQVVMEIGGGIPHEKQYKAVQIGGPSGGCIPRQHLDIEIDYESLKRVGAMMGSGGLVVMDEDTCMVDVAKFFMEFIQRESCGKCAPCREGTLRMLEILQRITRGRRSEKGLDALERFRGVIYLERLARVIKDTSLCGLGQTAPNPVLSTLRFFRDEYEAHLFERRCPAGVCQELRSFCIDGEYCTGCGLCKSRCPTHAIVGIAQKIHYIVEDKCIGCGACRDVCTHDAVLLAEPKPLAARAQREESESFAGIFTSDVFRGWHEGRKLLRG